LEHIQDIALVIIIIIITSSSITRSLLIGSSSHPKKHPDGVHFRNKTALRSISTYDTLVRVAKTVPVFKPFIDETLTESTSSQHTLLKTRLVFYPRPTIPHPRQTLPSMMSDG
ncbi:hypothetical protein BGX30_007167, partial [Mortierella sp. GBA39]